MTETLARTAVPQPAAVASTPIAPTRGAVAVAVIAAAAVAGFVVSRDAASAQAWHSAGPELARLLRGMAVLKAGMAAGAGALVVWRLRHPAGTGLAALYVVAAALMAASPGVLWHLAHVIAGAALFHAGLILMIALAWADRDATSSLLRARVGAQAGGGRA